LSAYRFDYLNNQTAEKHPISLSQCSEHGKALALRIKVIIKYF